MTTTIEKYLNSLSEDILTLDVSNKNIKSLPDLTRFKNLKTLICYNNKLTYLPTLPQNLKTLNCFSNKLTSLPILPQNLKLLNCSNNKLTLLPTLPQNLEELFCYNNKLNSLPTLPHNLKELQCSSNQLISLPTLTQNLERLYCSDNPIYEIVNINNLFETNYIQIVNINNLFQINNNIQILNNFRHLYYCLKFKKQLRKWLWEKVREPNAMKQYGPNYLIENLGDEDDLDAVLENWK
jgi:Leucine-rich repeat (LRR) protein